MSNSLSSSLRDYLDNESTKNNLLRALENILSNKWNVNLTQLKSYNII